MGGVMSRTLPGTIWKPSMENTPITIFNTSYTKTCFFYVNANQFVSELGNMEVTYGFKKNKDKEWSYYGSYGHYYPMQGAIALGPREKAFFSPDLNSQANSTSYFMFQADTNHDNTGAYLEISGDARLKSFVDKITISASIDKALEVVSAKNSLGLKSFSGSETIVEAPEIIPMGNEQQSYAAGMAGWYKDCVNLVKAPQKILGTRFADSCASAFENCVKIKRAPEIMPSKYVSTGGYLARMFYGCSNLSHMTVHFKGWAKNSFYGNTEEIFAGHNPWAEFETSDWVVGVAPKGVFRCPKELPIIHDTSHIPPGWDVVTF